MKSDRERNLIYFQAQDEQKQHEPKKSQEQQPDGNHMLWDIPDFH